MCCHSKLWLPAKNIVYQCVQKIFKDVRTCPFILLYPLYYLFLLIRWSLKKMKCNLTYGMHRTLRIRSFLCYGQEKLKNKRIHWNIVFFPSAHSFFFWGLGKQTQNRQWILWIYLITRTVKINSGCPEWIIWYQRVVVAKYFLGHVPQHSEDLSCCHLTQCFQRKEQRQWKKKRSPIIAQHLDFLKMKIMSPKIDWNEIRGTWDSLKKWITT